MTETSAIHAFDLAEATKHLAERDDCLKLLIEETLPFQIDVADAQSPYEALLESIAYQSISGKAAATIFGRVKALSATGRAPTPQEMLKLRKPALRKAGLSGAKILAMKDLAQKTIEGIVPSFDEALKLSDEELVERLVSVRGIGAWTVEMFLIFRLGRPDVLPVHDLGVKKGWAITYGKSTCLSPKNSSPLVNAGAPTAPSPVGICGAPASAPATPPCAKSAPRKSVNVSPPSLTAPPTSDCNGRHLDRLFLSRYFFLICCSPSRSQPSFFLTAHINPSNRV